MKKVLFMAAALAAGIMTVNAQDLVERTNLKSNWSIGVDGGVTTPMTGHAFFGSMRGVAGIHVGKQITPLFGAGIESAFGFNTSSWNSYPRSYTMVDNSYVGVYGTLNLMELFGGFRCEPRKFTIDAVLGAGWGHEYWAKSEGEDWNYFATKAGLNFNYNVTPKLTLAFKPSVTWNMSDADVSQTSAAYNVKKAVFTALIGVTYNFGPGFNCATLPADLTADVIALNEKVNALRAERDAALADLAVSTQNNADLAAALAACQAKPAPAPETNLNSVRFVFFRNASSAITADQMPNVEMIAAYMKNHKDAKVEVKGYASPTGSEEFNIKLAAARAEAVKTALVKKYGIAADRIVAKGEGIGHMFTEESWNRVSICTLEE